jgi:hypothetical protein
VVDRRRLDLGDHGEADLPRRGHGLLR